LFVLKLDAAARRVVVGPKEALRVRKIGLAEVNWLMDRSESSLACRVKVRSTRAAVPARVVRLEGGRAEVELLDGEDSVAPGQACVFYEEDGSRVLGGGWIVRSEPARAAARPGLARALTGA
jgi:tRNA-specific 2-thiouridylase